MQISEHELNRRELHAAAQSAITDAMDAFTQRRGEVTPAEWVAVLANAVRRWANYAMKDEWREESEG
jgi:hypothetical protein